MQIDTRIVAPPTKLLRGRTRYIGAIDEFGWFEDRVHDSLYSGEMLIEEKLKALGISPSILSGDSHYSTVREAMKYYA